MKSLVELRAEMDDLQDSEGWHDGSCVVARRVDAIRDEILTRATSECRCHDRSGSCEACQVAFSISFVALDE